MNRKRIVIASGDPAGCGPYITLEAIRQCLRKNVDFFVIGDLKIFKRLPQFLRLNKRINFIDLNNQNIEKIKYGYPTLLSGSASLSYLQKALSVMKREKIKRLVTAPLSKEAVKFRVKNFKGHTEYLARHFRVKNIAMLMASGKLKAILLTRHVSLAQASKLLKKELIVGVLNLVHQALRQQFKIKNPRITFASFNPHAGVDTFIGKEEAAILAARSAFKGLTFGPYPADTIFCGDNLKKYDCIICSYHDQGMIPFKMLSFKDGVNITLGLPIIRVSPAHGVAFDTVRSGRIPFHSSMYAAITTALKMAA